MVLAPPSSRTPRNDPGLGSLSVRKKNRDNTLDRPRDVPLDAVAAIPRDYNNPSENDAHVVASNSDLE